MISSAQCYQVLQRIAWFTLIVTAGDSACAGLSAMLAISVNQLMIKAATNPRLIAKVGCWLTVAISLALVAASIISWFTLIASIADKPAQALSQTVLISVNQASV